MLWVFALEARQGLSLSVLAALRAPYADTTWNWALRGQLPRPATGPWSPGLSRQLDPELSAATLSQDRSPGKSTRGDKETGTVPGPCGRFSPGGVSAKLTRLRPSSLYPGGPPEGLGHRLLSEPPSPTASSDRAEEGEASAETLRAAQVTRAALRLGGLCFRVSRPGACLVCWLASRQALFVPFIVHEARGVRKVFAAAPRQVEGARGLSGALHGHRPPSGGSALMT